MVDQHFSGMYLIWPSVWKEARVVPVHKKGSRSDYRPIPSYQWWVVFKRVVAEVACGHLKDNVLSDQHFGFKPGGSTSDQMMLITRHWQDTSLLVNGQTSKSLPVKTSVPERVNI